MLWPWLPVVLASSGDSPGFLVRSLDLLLDNLDLEILYQCDTYPSDLSSSDFNLFWRSLHTFLFLLHSFSKFWLSLCNCWRGMFCLRLTLWTTFTTSDWTDVAAEESTSDHAEPSLQLLTVFIWNGSRSSGALIFLKTFTLKKHLEFDFPQDESVVFGACVIILLL